MDRDLLMAWLGRGLSLNDIGALTDRDPSTVGYWVAKHRLTANGRAKYAPRGGLERDQLEPLVKGGATVREMAERLDRSPSTVRHWLARYGLKVSGSYRNRERALAAFAEGRARFTGTCRHHGETEFLVFRSGRHRCARCNTESVIRRRRRVKQALVEEAGGRCIRCGFDEHPAALQFHHLDRERKGFAISRHGVTRSIAEARLEVAKCVLLCASCHAMVEAGAVTLVLD
jgi:transposase